MSAADSTLPSLEGVQWRAQQAAHEERARALTRAHRERAARGEKHPVEDFLFTYYSYKPAILARWHPGAGVELRDAASERSTWRWYVTGRRTGSLRVDDEGYRREKSAVIAAAAKVVRATVERPARFGCFGLHEWAMVYRDTEHRHPLPLRLGRQGTDAVVESHDLRCTHFDAFRFFTDDAVPRNAITLTRGRQPLDEQPGCLHAGMDLYKWAVKLGPLTPGDLLLDAFELARDIRVLDMRASPYDLASHGYSPVQIETAEGKAQYVEAQRAFSARGQVLRERLLSVIDGGAI